MRTTSSNPVSETKRGIDGGLAMQEMMFLNREEVDTNLAESFFDELSSYFTVTIKPTEELEPATDYFLLLRNGLPVLPVGAGCNALPQYRAAGTVCEDRLIRFRTETKSHRKMTTKALQNERSGRKIRKRTKNESRRRT